MKISWTFGRIMTGIILMFSGVLLMFVFETLPGITELVFGNVVNMIIGVILFVIGLVTFTNQLNPPKRQKKERVYQKSKYKFIEIFGLE